MLQVALQIGPQLPNNTNLQAGLVSKYILVLLRLLPDIPHFLLEGSLDEIGVSALIPIFARLRYLENLVLIPKQLVGVSNGDNLTELAFELVLMIGVLCYPLHEEPKKNALDFFRQCSKLVEVTLVREQDSHRFTLTKEDRMNNDLDAFVTDSYDPKDNGRYGY
ncbi:F-box domain-containing protein [Colletotrichum tofieldiae]|nr:F-box domain-containing protein [Colletotrichum tofieldiae]